MLGKPEKPLSYADPPEQGPGGNVDKVLFKNLVEMVPLVQSLMDRRANSSFTRRASVVYTPTPSHPKKVNLKGSKTAQSVSARKRREYREDAVNGFFISSSREVTEESGQMDREELDKLRQQVDELHKKLIEKDEALKSAENSMDKMNEVHASLENLRCQVAEKESLVKSTNTQLYDAKIKLADKQAALEKLEWEARMSNRKVEELQGDLLSMDVEVKALMQVFEELSKNDSATHHDDKIVSYDHFDPLPDVDDFDWVSMDGIEEARIDYIAAVAAAKENPCEQSLVAAAEARFRLQAFLF